jgi:hypothetical protein
MSRTKFTPTCFWRIRLFLSACLFGEAFPLQSYRGYVPMKLDQERDANNQVGDPRPQGDSIAAMEQSANALVWFFPSCVLPANRTYLLK